MTFSLKDATGLPVVGAKNFEFTIAKLIPATSTKPAYWQSYINRSVLATGGARVLRAAGERQVATEVEPGVYSYKFCTSLTAAASFKYYGSGTEPADACATAAVGRSGVLDSAAALPILAGLDLAYAPNATHRLAIVSRNDGANRPRFNAVMDFVPAQLPAMLAVKASQVVTNESCGACHAASSADRARLNFDSFHGGTRFDVAVCSTCHNPSTYDSLESTDVAWTQYCSDTKHWCRLMPLVQQFAAMAHVEVAHLALDAARVEAPSAADAAPMCDFIEQCVAPLRQPLRGERPRLAASFA